ncbi:MAG: dihydrodipicolinate reductase [Firmicutes bacterium]|nr:dihydrodipicolinate reductase [Bacillota bacterium]NSW92633.1 dihydrodipicolinate reductase [Bacillota bacterium]
MKDKIKVIQYGLGPIGIKLTQYLVDKPAMEIVGAVDIDPKKVGADIGELAGLPEPLGIIVTGDAETLLGEVEADVVALTTTSSLEKIKPLVMEILSHGVNVVTTCEELSYPWLTNPQISGEIDVAAREKNVSVLSAGVNPGFLMDFLPIAVTGVCRQVKRITVERIQDAQFRRIPFQKKIGAGLTVEQFQERVREGTLRHVGLTESIHMIAAKMGWRLDKAEDIISPIIADEKVVAGGLTVEAGKVLGVQQIGRGIVQGEERITLVFRASIGEKDPRDRVVIEGTPDIDMVIKGGVNGDIATCAIVANAIPAVVGARPGLRTMADIEVVSYFE